MPALAVKKIKNKQKRINVKSKLISVLVQKDKIFHYLLAKFATIPRL